MIELINLHKSFGTQKVLNGLNLRLRKGEITCIIGQSGTGKSVLLKHIVGLMRPDSGEVRIDGVDITKVSQKELNLIRRRIGYLFQDAALFDSMNVEENVAFPLKEHTKLKPDEIKSLVREKLRLVGLKGVGHKMPSELSGGMRKRVGLARALALDPEIILFDEPTSGLDPVMADAIDRLIVETQIKLDVTTVIISHDILSVFKIAHHVAMLYNGKIIADGRPEEIKASDDPIVRQFISGSAEGPLKVY